MTALGWTEGGRRRTARMRMPGEPNPQRDPRDSWQCGRKLPYSDLPVSSQMAHQNQVEDLFLSVTLAALFRETQFQSSWVFGASCPATPRARTVLSPARVARPTSRSP